MLELARIAWNKSLKEFYYPPLNEPNFVFDYTKREGFYIDPSRQWQITMNLANAPPNFLEDEEYIKYFHAISMHEISHYVDIPYDGLTNAKLLKSAMKHVNQNFAPIVVNVFADLIIDYKLYKKYPDLMSWELEGTYNQMKQEYQDKLSSFSKFMFHAYEKMWGVEIEKDKDNFSDVVKQVNRVRDIILEDFWDESTWEDKVRLVAYHLRELCKDTFTFIGMGTKTLEGHQRRNGPGTGATLEVPEDVIELMDNPLENKNSDKLHDDNADELRQKAEEFARNTPFSEFGAPASQAGILKSGQQLATWYRGLAKHLIEIQIFEEKPGGQVPAYPETWRLGDPIEELDIVQTLLTSPLIIPNMTTRKWAYREGPGILIEEQIPDLLLVLDSSGSMDWNYTSQKHQGLYHTALVASFAALHHAAKKGVKFSVINFSGYAQTCNWTNDYERAEKVLLNYQGDGTVLPITEIKKQCGKAERPCLVFIITDFGINNWKASKKTMLELVDKGHKMVGFFIGSTNIPESKFGDLLNKVTFYPIRTENDLINLVIKEIKQFYS